MESQNNAQQQQKAPTVNLGKTINNSGSSSNSSGGIVSGASDSPRHLSNYSTAVTIDNADFFTLDGLQYNLPGWKSAKIFTQKGGGTDAYNLQDLYHDGVFSSDDLYAVVDPTNPNAAVTEIDNDSSWQSASFIPLGTSDLKQLGSSSSAAAAGSGDGVPATPSGRGMDMSSGGYTTNGAFYRLIALTNESNGVRAPNTAYTEVSPSPTNISEDITSAEATTVATLSGGDVQQPDVMASPAAGASGSQDGAAQVKIRKPRGRKPKHVKEAEAAAAAAAAAAASTRSAPTPPPPGEGSTSSLSPPGSTYAVAGSPATGRFRPNMGERYETAEDIPPNVTVHHRPGGSSATTNPQATAASPSPYLQHQQQVTNTTVDAAAPRYPSLGHTQQQQQQQRQMSLEQLASHDRHAILMARRNNQQRAPEPYHPQYPQLQQTTGYGYYPNNATHH